MSENNNSNIPHLSDLIKEISAIVIVDDARNVSDEEMAEIEKHLQDAGVRTEKSPYDSRILLARDLEGAESLSDFQEGSLTVQDASSVLAVKMAGIQKGNLVVDACAAPGGKSILASELVGTNGKIICGDLSSQKTDKIAENIARMNINNIEI